MKKIYSIIIGLLLLFPFSVCAKEGITDYFMDITVESNGDIYVKELFYLAGEYNGYERIVNFKNLNVSPFTGDYKSFEGSSIYNGDDIELIQIAGIDSVWNPSMEDLNREKDLFKQVNVAYKGQYGVYIVSNENGGRKFRIYNSASMDKGFYLEYRIKNMAVVHNDIAELGYNIFSNQQNEYIENLEVNIHLPNNQTELRAWGHGPLWGDTKNIGSDQVKLTIHDLDPNTAIDIRVVFDKNVVKDSTKLSNVDGLNTILEIEKKKAENANQIRENIRKKLEREQKIKKLLYHFMIGALILWPIGLIILWIYIYIKYDKEYQSSFKNPYYRDFPSNDIPSTIGYLMNKKVGNNELSASILNLIYEKKIDFEPLDKKDYKLTKKATDLSGLDYTLCDFLFDDKDTVTLSELKKQAKNSYSSFLRRYNSWVSKATSIAKERHFYEEKNGKYLGILYIILGWIFIIVSLMNYLGIPSILYAITGISSFIFLSYIVTFNKRTKEGNELYSKWKALKKFMLDFGNFEDKELPEIKLWEKYLVYAIVFGCASKLSKQMKIKIENLGNTYSTDMINYNRFNDILIFNHIVTQSVSSAISVANSVRIADSSDSSSGGFGGGFSGGGGSFGGGGGGGRF